MEATHKLVVSKLSADLWQASSKCLSDKVPLMQHLISSVEIYLQSIVKKNELIRKDKKVLNLIGIRTQYDSDSNKSLLKPPSDNINTQTNSQFSNQSQLRASDLGSSFSSVTIFAKDYAIGKKGKSQIIYTVQLKQMVNPLAANKDIRIQADWNDVKQLLLDFQLIDKLQDNPKSKDEKFLTGLKLLLVSLPTIARQKFI